MFGSLRDRQILSTHSFVGTLNVYTYTIDKVCRTSFSLATPTVLFTVESLGPVQSIDRIAKHWNFVRLPTTAQRFLHASGPSAFEDRLVRLAATEQKFGTICQPFDVDLPWKCLSPCQEPWCEDHVKLHMLHRVLLLCCVWYKYSDHSAMYNDIFLHALHLHETNPVSFSEFMCLFCNACFQNSFIIYSHSPLVSHVQGLTWLTRGHSTHIWESQSEPVKSIHSFETLTFLGSTGSHPCSRFQVPVMVESPSGELPMTLLTDFDS